MPAHHAGNIAILNFEWSILVLAVFSALIPWLAVALRLPKETIEKHLNETEQDTGPKPSTGQQSR